MNKLFIIEILSNNKSFSAPSNLKYNYNFGFYVLVPFSESFHLFWVIFLSLVVFAIFTRMLNNFSNITSKTFSFFLFLFLSLCCFLTIKFPTISFCFVLILILINIMSIFTGNFLTLTVPFLDKILVVKIPFIFTQLSNKFFYFILDIFEKIKIFRLLETLHINLFYKLSVPTFESLTLLCHSLSFLYLVTNRLIYFKIDSFLSPDILYLLLFISLYFVWFRAVISLSIRLVQIYRNINPLALDPVLRVDPFDPNEFPPKPDYKSKSLFAFHRTNNYHHLPPTPKKFTAWQKGTAVAAFATVAITGLGTYYAYQHLQSSRDQTVELKRQTVELKRQNDLEEVSQGLMTREEFKNKYKDIK